MEELRLKIIDLCNKSGLPLEAIVFVVRDVYRDVTATFEEMQKKVKEENRQEEKE